MVSVFYLLFCLLCPPLSLAAPSRRRLSPSSSSSSQAEKLLDRGLHPVRIAEGYDKACQIGVKTLADISDQVDVQKGDASKTLFNTASTTLSSKIVNVHRDQVVRCCCCCFCSPTPLVVLLLMLAPHCFR